MPLCGSQVQESLGNTSRNIQLHFVYHIPIKIQTSKLKGVCAKQATSASNQTELVFARNMDPPPKLQMSDGVQNFGWHLQEPTKIRFVWTFLSQI